MKKTLPKHVLIGVLSTGVIALPLVTQYAPITVSAATQATQAPVTQQAKAATNLGKISTVFPDRNLAAAVATQLKKQVNDELTSLDVQATTSLIVDGLNVSDDKKVINIEGIEKFTELKDLRLLANKISNIAPISQLTKLETFFLSGNVGLNKNLEPLRQLKNLKDLRLWATGIDDVSALAGLTNLTNLGLGSNNISDVTPLSQLTNLTGLLLEDNKITDISPLANLNKLTTVRLYDQKAVKVNTLFNVGKATTVQSLVKNAQGAYLPLTISDSGTLNATTGTITWNFSSDKQQASYTYNSTVRVGTVNVPFNGSVTVQVPDTPLQSFTPYALYELGYSPSAVTISANIFRNGDTLSVSPPYGNGLSMSVWVTREGYASLNYPLSVTNAHGSKLWISDFEITIGKKLYAPVINKIITTASTDITGYGVPGAVVHVKKDSQTVGQAIVNEYGQYNVTIPKQASGTDLTVMQTKGVEFSIDTKTKILPPNTFPSPLIYKTDKDYAIIGTGSPGTAVSFSDGEIGVSASDTISSDGYYVMRANTTQNIDLLGAQHVTTEHFVFREIANTPTVTGTVTPATYKVGGSYVTGAFTGGVTKGLLVINGVPQSMRGDFTSTGFRYYIEGSKIKAGDHVEFVGLNAQNKVITLGKKVSVTP
ncbi:leucine-rich repeat domain-containing protein [Listeria grandensis]|uniref:immunoglobulin-like domain-containing protein n=1 Tax=Listeria grandensis TaxID=1494963 RepID=UPI0016293BFC|nr:immunoglobulin-like domain-containing protein [Listeria grandensis]MBC1475142.1 leucine-rich repeat domain-containing protein [Listeria grandensis]